MKIEITGFFPWNPNLHTQETETHNTFPNLQFDKLNNKLQKTAKKKLK